MAQRTLLAIGHAQSATGFSRVLHSLLPFLCDSFEVHHFGPNLFGEPFLCRWTIHPNPLPVDIHGIEQLTRLMRSLQPDVVLVLQDIWQIPVYSDVIRKLRTNVKIVAYCPVDGRIVEPSLLDSISELDRLVLYNNFARLEVEQALRTIATKESLASIDRIDVIPHGIDTELFHPYRGGEKELSAEQGKTAARQILFSDRPVADDAFIALNASRNQPRKRLDITIDGFALFAEDKPDNVHLYLHTGMTELDVDILHRARNAGIHKRLLVTEMSNDHPSVSSEKLNLIYNACDVGVNTASGESWGLVSFEHAATQRAQIVPRHSGCEELWQNTGVLLEPGRFEPMGTFLEAALVSPEEVAAALNRLYWDRDYRNTKAAAAFQNATRPMYRWEAIADQWKDLLATVLAES